MPSHSHRQTLGVILLAAGASSRMGKPKMLLPWGHTSVLGHLIAQWQKMAAEQIVVVTAANDQLIEKELDRLGFPDQSRILNPSPELGMFSSIQCAAGWPNWKPDLTHWVIALGDQPHLREETLRALLTLSTTHPEAICQLSRQGRPRHPVLLPAHAFLRLQNSKHHNLKDFLRDLPLQFAFAESEDAGLDVDIDHPSDYEKALHLRLLIPIMVLMAALTGFSATNQPPQNPTAAVTASYQITQL